MNAITIRSAFDLGEPEKGLSGFGKSRTQQHFASEVNINSIMEKYFRTGVVDRVSRLSPVFGDFSQVGSYDEALLRVMSAQEAFDALPAAVRQRFSNDPQEIIDFVSDSKNKDEAISLGLIDKPIPVVGPAPAVVAPVSAVSVPPGAAVTTMST